MKKPITIATALVSLRPGAQWIIRDDVIEWLDQEQSEPSQQEIQNEIARLTAQEPFELCKDEAKARIARTDWSVLPDVGLSNVSEFQVYRAALRALIKDPVVAPTWPVEPEPIWS
jgi:hypothetical protein